MLIDKLRSKSRVFEAGARLVPIATPTFNMARLTQDAATTWHAENTADLLQKGPQFDRVTFAAKTLSTLVVISRELVEDAPNVNEVVANSGTKAIALELDRAALLGDGSSNSITGLANDANVTKTALNAAPADYSSLVSSAGRNLANSAALPTAFIMAPRVLTQFSNLRDTLYQPLRRPDLIANIPFLDTAKIPTNDESRSPVVANASKMHGGDFTEMMVGMRVGLDLRILRERYADAGQVAFWAWTRLDMQLAHAASFDIITDLRAA